MAVGSNLAGVARVAFSADTGQFNAELAAAEARYARTTGVMSDDAIRMSLAQDKLNRALSRFGPESRQAQSATLALRAAQRQTASTSGTLSHELSSVNRSSREAASGLHVFTRDVERASAGAAIGSRAIRGLRSVVLFGGASVLGGFGAATAVRAFVTAAREQEQVQAGIRTQLHALGLSYGQYRGEIDRTLQAQGKLSSFGKDDLGRSFTTLVRRTGDVSQALRLNAVAADIARARHADLATTSALVSRALNGNRLAATSLGLPLAVVTKNLDALRASGEKVTAQQVAYAKAQDRAATGLAVVAEAQTRYAGAAAAYGRTSAGAQDKFNHTLHDTEAIIGRAITPALAHLANSLAAYLTKLNDSGRLQKDVNHIVRDGTNIVYGLRDAFVGIRPVVAAVNTLLGGTRNSVKVLAEIFIGLKLAGYAREMGLFGAATATAGRAAAVSAGEYKTLAVAETNVGRSAVVSRIGQYTGAVEATGGAAVVSAGKVGRLRGSLVGLNAISLAPIVVPITIEVSERVNAKVEGFLGKKLGKAYDVAQFFATGGTVGTNPVTAVADAFTGKHKRSVKTNETLAQAVTRMRRQGFSEDEIHNQIRAWHPDWTAAEISQALNPSGSTDVPQYPGGKPTVRRGGPGFRDLPYAIRQAVSDAGLTASQADDRAAAVRAAAFLRNELRTAKLTHAQRLQLTDELGSELSAIQSIDDQASQKAGEARRKSEEAAKRREAAERAAHLAVLGRRQTGIENRITRAQTREGNAGNLTALRKAQRQEQQGYRDLIAFYNTEARDSRLTASQRDAARRNAARARRDLTRAIVKDQEDARTQREDTLKLSVTNAQAALDSATKGTAQWTKAKERLDRAYSAEIAFYNAEAKNEKLSLKAKAKARQQAADARKAKAQLDKGGKGSQSDAAALIREFLSEQRGLYGGASNVFTEPKPDGERTPGTTVVVNRHFNAPPTTNRHREAIYANRAMRSAFDS